MAEVVETRGVLTEAPLLTSEVVAGRRRLSWGAIFAGTIAALGLWILLYLLEANRANIFVKFVHGTADWLSWWSQDISRWTQKDCGSYSIMDFPQFCMC